MWDCLRWPAVTGALASMSKEAVNADQIGCCAEEVSSMVVAELIELTETGERLQSDKESMNYCQLQLTAGKEMHAQFRNREMQGKRKHVVGCMVKLPPMPSRPGPLAPLRAWA